MKIVVAIVIAATFMASYSSYSESTTEDQANVNAYYNDKFKELEARRASLEKKCKSENKIICYTGEGCCEDGYTDADYAAAAAADAAPIPGTPEDIRLQNERMKIFAEYVDSHEKKTLVPVQRDRQSPTPTLEIKIKQGMEYGQARKILINSGWQAVNANRTPNGTPVCFLVASMQDWSFENEIACKYNEIDDCSGTGMRYCKMIFYDGDGGFLSVITSGGRPPDAVIENWTKEPSFEAEVIPLDEISNYKN